ncbi:MAG: tRNA (adenosine(37)-N6)-threonylcarbamoyltransferase complex ATPase subunit type 1 TsaE [Gammaproteobacteria bacterium]|nr:tRNA (adenosine(37)-N6)-threonylcarbamoyltransferase complex ATPase subunit type 1 TsaE [Gammaproteobacteria bacterium]
MSTNWVSHSVADTHKLAGSIASYIRPGDVLALCGTLASGKTTFVQGLCKSLGVSAPVNSPTFTLINEYSGKFPIYHFDCYRLESEEELFSLGYEEYFYGEGVVLIEWADRIRSLLPDYSIALTFHHDFSQETSRKIILECQDARQELCDSLL